MKLKLTLILFILSLTVNQLSAQSDLHSTVKEADSSEIAKVDSIVKEDELPNPVYIMADTKTQFPGGKGALIEFISNNLIYPKEAIENKIDGKVTLKFVVDSKGKICCVDIVGTPIGYGLEEEAIRIIKSMPRWTPALKDNRPVSIYYQLPIWFSYTEE